MKPGWVRVNLHYVFTEKDIQFLIRAIEFIAEYGERFLKIYAFDPHTADWKHKDYVHVFKEISIETDYNIESIKYAEIEKLREGYFKTAIKINEHIEPLYKKDFIKDVRNVEELKYFYYCLESERKEG